MIAIPLQTAIDLGKQAAFDKAVGHSDGDSLPVLYAVVFFGIVLAVWLHFSNMKAGYRLKTFAARFIGNSIFATIVSLTAISTQMTQERFYVPALEASKMLSLYLAFAARSCEQFSTFADDKEAQEFMNTGILLTEILDENTDLIDDPSQALRQLNQTAAERGIAAKY